VGDDEGYLHVQAQLDGRMMGREKVSGDGLRAQMVVADGTLYVLDNGGSLSAYRVTVK
jgi:outer membrane protein assembly factor BamB